MFTVTRLQLRTAFPFASVTDSYDSRALDFRPMLSAFRLHDRARASGVHLLISSAVALAAAVLVFGLWYPGVYRLLAGGRELFFLVVSVDVVLGPVLTFAVFNPAKSRKHLRRDLATIGFIQMAALFYGLHTVYVARPVAMVFEVDRFTLVGAVDVYVPELPHAAPEYRSLPVTGPMLLGTRAPGAGAENTEALFLGLRGVDIGQRPLFWQPYELSAAAAIARSKPISALAAHYPARAAELRQGLVDLHAPESSARFLPVSARGDWVVVLDQAGMVLGYLPFDGFF
jgi:hypothetical protein